MHTNLTRQASHSQEKVNLSAGQALMEAIVAMGVLTVGFLGVFSLLSQSLGLNRVVSDNYTATYLAAEGIEVVKNIIDSNVIASISQPGIRWDSGLPDGAYEVEFDSTGVVPSQNRLLSFDPNQNLYSYSGFQISPFRRTITLEHVSANELKVISRVAWVTRGGGNFNVNLEDHFYNWR